MKILFTGDMVGSAGRQVFQRVTDWLRDEGRIDLVIANADNAAGAAALTLGDHASTDHLPYFEQIYKLIFSHKTPGRCSFVRIR